MMWPFHKSRYVDFRERLPPALCAEDITPEIEYVAKQLYEEDYWVSTRNDWGKKSNGKKYGRMTQARFERGSTRALKSP